MENTVEIIKERVSVKQFMIDNSLTVVAHQGVRVNSNGYPFVTFVDSQNISENIYFSKSQGVHFSEGDKIEKGFFDNLMVIELKYEDGSIRKKLCSDTVGAIRMSVEDLF
ncbi:MAG: hypothetical protein ACRC5G_03330 [Cetobacterium sp.]